MSAAPKSVDEIIEEQIEREGASCIRVDDGHVFTFPLEILRALLASAQATGRVVVFVQHRGGVQ